MIQDFDKSDSLMLIAKTGYISLYALHLFALKHLTISLHNLNGKLIYSKIPEMLNNHIDNRILQYGMYFKNRKEIADKIVELKRKKYNELLREYWLSELTDTDEAVFSNVYFA